MKITKNTLKQIIKEELAKVLNEAMTSPDAPMTTRPGDQGTMTPAPSRACPEGQAQYQYVMIDGELTDIDSLGDDSWPYEGCIDHEEAHPGMSYDEFQRYVMTTISP